MDEKTKILVERWLIKAENDLRTAQTMLNVEPPTTDTICFHSQQCVEKCLKAFLTYSSKHVEKMHHLPSLVDQCSKIDPEFDKLREIAFNLTDYAVTDRYPDNWRDIPIEEASEAVEAADHVIEFIRRKIT